MIRASVMGQRTKKRIRPNRTRKRLGRLPPTPEFLKFGSYFHQDVLVLQGTWEAATLDVVASFNGEDRKRLRDFIGTVLESDLSPDELKKLWDLTGSDWYLDGAALRTTLALAHDGLRKGLSRREARMLFLDHLAVVAPTLAEGVAHVRASLDLDIPEGGRHREMGTRNHLLRLGEALFLEVIAVDPEAPPPDRPRWFGLDDAAAVRADWESGRRLRAFVARTNDLDGALARRPGLFGSAMRMSRGALSWRFALRGDGALPMDGLLPCLMDWDAAGHPARAMPDLGARLLAFRLDHPDPEAAAALYREIGLLNPPEIRAGAVFRYTAEIETPAGPRILG